MRSKSSFHTTLTQKSHSILNRYNSDSLTGEIINKNTIIDAALKLMHTKIKGDPAILRKYLK